MPSGDLFATSIVNSYFSPTSTLSICNAGHPPPLILRVGSRRWEVLEVESREEDMPLGIVETGTYSQIDVPMNTGDMLFCYTDGVIESENSEAAPLGIGGLESVLNTLPTDRPERLLTDLVGQIASSSSDGSHEDDLTMLLFRITNRPVPLRDNLAAPLRWLRSLFVTT
jgi:serine phosphatase RsbU (regulator of sigma subunit)